MYKIYIKRILDIIISLIGMILLIPFYIIVSFCIAISMGMPIIFSQKRIGKNGREFKLYKFRTMTNETDENGILLDEQLRLTKIGIILRTLSIDEIPELWNIFIGDMSIVGPRPLPTYYEPYFLEEEKQRHEMKGGLIPPDGLSGETTPLWEKQFEYDIYYVHNVSFLLDVKIILVTIGILFKRIRKNYGAEDRPHLNEYRKHIASELKEKEESNVQ